MRKLLCGLAILGMLAAPVCAEGNLFSTPEKESKTVRIVLGIACIGVGLADVFQNDSVSAFSGAGMAVIGIGVLSYRF